MNKADRMFAEVGRSTDFNYINHLEKKGKEKYLLRSFSKSFQIFV